MENKEVFDELYTNLYNQNFDELEKARQTDEKIVKQELEKIRKEEEKSGRKLFNNPVNFLLAILALYIIFLVDAIFPKYDLMEQTIVKWIIYVIVIYNIINMILIFATVKKERIIESNSSNLKYLEYFNLFRERIVTPIISSVLENSNYYYDKGLGEKEYVQGDWDFYDRYSSEDMITAEITVDKIKNIKTKLVISEVYTEKKLERNGKIGYIPVFSGMAGYIDLPKDIGCYLKVTNNNFFTPNNKFEMDMDEFEKIFEVHTDNQIKAMQILTTDIMYELIELFKLANVKFEFYINHSRMYIRFHTCKIFETYLSDKTIQYEKLKKYFDILNSVKNITEHICKIILNTEL